MYSCMDISKQESDRNNNYIVINNSLDTMNNRSQTYSNDVEVTLSFKKHYKIAYLSIEDTN